MMKQFKSHQWIISDESIGEKCILGFMNDVWKDGFKSICYGFGDYLKDNIT